MTTLRPVRSGAVLLILVLSLSACLMPSLDEQRQQILQGQVILHRVGVQAFLDVWGRPTYERTERTQFFVVEDGSYIPRFRVPLGEQPRGWVSMTAVGEARYLGYAERGELLGFLDDVLVYRERMTPAAVHAVGELWKRDDRFKTDLEKAVR